MKIFNTLILLIAVKICFAQGNLLHNAGFEDVLAPGLLPADQAQVDNHMQVWVDDIRFTNCTTTSSVHTPDWYIISTYKLKTTPGNVLVNARNGIGYLGMGAGELIEQNLFNSNPLINGKEYEISLYFQFPGVTASWDNQGLLYSPVSIPPMSDVHLKVFMASHVIEYSNNNEPSCNSQNPTIADWTDQSDFCDHLDGILHHHTVIADFTLNTNSYPVGGWHRLNQRFTVPNNNTNYDWIAFEVQCDNGSYIIMDDMELTRSCDLGCTNVSNGSPNPTIGSYPGGGPKAMGAVITNLQNVETVKIEVFSISGGSPIRTQQFTNNNGFSGPVFWDGNTDAPSPAASDSYLIKLTCTNACGTFTFSGNVFNPGTLNYPPETNPPANVTSADIQVTDCCELTKSLNNKTFGPGPAFSPSLWHYRPRNTIDMTSCTIQSNRATMELIAGESISILLTSIDPGANEFQAYIQPCADASRPINPSLNYESSTEQDDSQLINQLTTDNKKVITDEQSLKAIAVTPNPSSSGFFELLNVGNIEDLSITIYSSTGVLTLQTQKSKTIDLSQFNKGVYIVEIYKSGRKIVKKIIYI